jgi:hypothetical protein
VVEIFQLGAGGVATLQIQALAARICKVYLFQIQWPRNRARICTVYLKMYIFTGHVTFFEPVQSADLY